MDDCRFETRESHAGRRPDTHGALKTPIYANSTAEYGSPTELGGSLVRFGLGTVSQADLLADLERGIEAARE